MRNGRATDQVRLARTGRAGDQNRRLFEDESAGCQLGNQGVIDRRTVAAIETFQSLVADHLRLAQALGKLTLITTGDFVLDQQRQEVGVG